MDGQVDKFDFSGLTSGQGANITKLDAGDQLIFGQGLQFGSPASDSTLDITVNYNSTTNISTVVFELNPEGSEVATVAITGVDLSQAVFNDGTFTISSGGIE
ncbi:hypothetical protein [Gulbenkiania mobilis]|uniref:hypothetical protein n=1 Tax=Gulbenkiania mobilis TaxID=397457 RepID=UPI00296F9937